MKHDDTHGTYQKSIFEACHLFVELFSKSSSSITASHAFILPKKVKHKRIVERYRFSYGTACHTAFIRDIHMIVCMG